MAHRHRRKWCSWCRSQKPRFVGQNLWVLVGSGQNRRRKLVNAKTFQIRTRPRLCEACMYKIYGRGDIASNPIIFSDKVALRQFILETLPQLEPSTYFRINVFYQV